MIKQLGAVENMARPDNPARRGGDEILFLGFLKEHANEHMQMLDLRIRCAKSRIYPIQSLLTVLPIYLNIRPCHAARSFSYLRMFTTKAASAARKNLLFRPLELGSAAAGRCLLCAGGAAGTRRIMRSFAIDGSSRAESLCSCTDACTDGSKLLPVQKQNRTRCKR